MDIDDLIDQFISDLDFEVVVVWANILEVEVNPPPLGDMCPDWETELRTEVGDAMRKVGQKMNPRINYEMTEDDLRELLTACKPVPCMMIGSMIPSSPQENANRAWAKLGEKMGFDSMTVQPSNQGDRFFSAVPSETDAQREAREKREVEEKKKAEIDLLNKEIAERQDRLNKLTGGGH